MFSLPFTAANATFSCLNGAFLNWDKNFVSRNAHNGKFKTFCGEKWFLSRHRNFDNCRSTESFIFTVHSQRHKGISNQAETRAAIWQHIWFLNERFYLSYQGHRCIIENTSCPQKMNFSDYHDRQSDPEFNKALTTKFRDSVFSF